MWQLSWMVFRCFCLDATQYAGKDICTKATMCITIMSTELEENGIQSMNIQIREIAKHSCIMLGMGFQHGSSAFDGLLLRYLVKSGKLQWSSPLQI